MFDRFETTIVTVDLVRQIQHRPGALVESRPDRAGSRRLRIYSDRSYRVSSGGFESDDNHNDADLTSYRYRCYYSTVFFSGFMFFFFFFLFFYENPMKYARSRIVARRTTMTHRLKENTPKRYRHRRGLVTPQSFETSKATPSNAACAVFLFSTRRGRTNKRHDTFAYETDRRCD